MSYAFVASSSQFLSVASLPATGYGLTMYAQILTSSSAAQSIMNYGNSAAITEYVYLGKLATTNYVTARHRNTAMVDGVSDGATGISDGAWHAAVGKFTSAASVTAYTDGTAATTGTQNLTAFPANLNRFGIGALLRSTEALFVDGQLAEVAIWGVALDAAEIVSLAKGFKPTRIRPQSLKFYAPLVRNLTDLKGGLTITNNNAATVAAHPRVY